MLTQEQRHEMIAVAAYYLAERRGFAPGASDEDWALAEQQIERLLTNMQQAGKNAHDLDSMDLPNALRMWGGNAHVSSTEH